MATSGQDAPQRRSAADCSEYYEVARPTQPLMIANFSRRPNEAFFQLHLQQTRPLTIVLVGRSEPFLPPSFDLHIINLVLRQLAQTYCFLTKGRKEPMTVREVTFEELLAILRTSAARSAKLCLRTAKRLQFAASLLDHEIFQQKTVVSC